MRCPAHPANSVIQVTLASSGGWTRIAVADEGIGISEELRPKLFDTYARRQGSGDSRASGLGLWLAIVKGFVDLHGGAIDVDSAGSRMGSTFAIVLPTAVMGEASFEA